MNHMLTHAAKPYDTVFGTHGLRSIPAVLGILLGATVASSSFVMVEPAPCDVLFVLTFSVALLSGHAVVPTQLRLPIYIGLYMFVFANLLSGMLCRDAPDCVFFMGVTGYLLLYFLFMAGLVKRYGIRMVHLLAKAYLLAAIIAGSIGVAARFGWIPHAELFFRSESGHRVRSTFKDPNVFAPFLVGAIVLVISQLMIQRRVRLGYIACLAVLCLGVMLAFSRGALIHLAVSLVVYVFLQLAIVGGRHTVKRLGYTLVPSAVLVASLGLYVLGQAGQMDYFARRMSFQKYDEQRFATQAFAVSMVEKAPWGIGAGQWTHDRFGRATHSLYLRVLVENGVLGAVGLGIFLVACLWTCMKGILARGPHVHLYVACFSVLFGILVDSLVIDTLHWRHFFLFLAIPVGLWAHERLAAHAQEPRRDSEGEAHTPGPRAHERIT